MESIILGKTGLSISRLGFGGIPIQRTDAATVKELIHLMLDKGINYIDTARGYTVSEEYLGEALEGLRDRFVLATKSMSRSKEAMAKDIAISLGNLRTNYIDLYQVHNPSPAQLEEVCAPGGALEALMEAKENGQVGHLGVTAHTLETFQMALNLDWVETIMFPYNIVETQGEELIAQCKERNIGFIAMKPLAGGAIDNPELALRFICNNPSVSVVIPGMYTEEEILSNLTATENNAPLTSEEKEQMQQIRKSLGGNFCRRCNYCQPCVKGIPIANVFTFYGYYERYGLEDWAKDRYKALPVNASDCIQCGVCESRCPYNLPIREMLKDAVNKFQS